MNYLDELIKLKDEKYAKFQSKLTPGIDKELFIGVRVPNIRKLTKEILKKEDPNKFLNSLPHKYYDENMLHGFLISEIKDYDECINRLNEFLPYVDNWAVCDTMKPKVFKKNKDKLILNIKKWIKSKEIYTCRFGIEMLMNNYLKENYKKEYINLPLIDTDDYYLKMMIAWFYAEALVKQWNDAILIIENKKLNKWIHNKAIQKAIESYRITSEQKEYLKSLKIK